MNLSHGPEPQPRPRSQWRVVLLIGCLLLLPLGLLVAYYLERQGAADRELRDAIADTDRRDPGWRFEDLERQRPAIPDERNAAPQVLAVRKLLPTPWPSPSKEKPGLDELLGDLEPQVQLNEEQLRELRAQLKAAQAALKKADHLADLPDGRYPLTWGLDFVSASIEHLQQSRLVANLLRFEAMRQAQDGDPDGACRSELALLNTGRSIGEEYTLIILLIRTSIAALATQTLERTLAQGEPTEASLAAVQQALEREEKETPALTVTAFRGERALAHRMMDAMERGELSLSSMTGTPSFGERLADVLNAGMVRHSHAVYLRYLMEAVELAKAPGPEQLARRKELLAAPEDRRAWLAMLLIPAADKVLGSEWRKLAQLRCAITALALERYRKAQHHWPESLEALTPAYLAAVPVDPYDGRPLRYLRLSDGVEVYSIGPDSVDNGGKIDRKNPQAEGSDLGFRLWDVARRRQPAPPPTENKPPAGEDR
jgi:hypothetical protein